MTEDERPATAASVTELLARIRKGHQEARGDLWALVYRELRRLAQSAFRHEDAGHTLQPTALVHEAFLRLCDDHAPAFNDRAHFLGVAARVMRQILVDHARARHAQKRGAHLTIALDEQRVAAPQQADVLELDHALGELGREDARLVALIEMRFFAGMTAEEIAGACSGSVHVVRHDLRYAQARLREIITRS